MTEETERRFVIQLRQILICEDKGKKRRINCITTDQYEVETFNKLNSLSVEINDLMEKNELTKLNYHYHPLKNVWERD